MHQITIRTPNLKCRLYWCLIEFIGWRYRQSCRYFRPLLCTSASNFLTGSLPPSPPSLCMNKYRGTVCNGGGGGDWVVWRASTGVIHCVCLTKFRTYKIVLPPQTKTQEGRGPQTDKHLPCRKVPLQVNFQEKPTWGLLVIWSMVSYITGVLADQYCRVRDAQHLHWPGPGQETVHLLPSRDFRENFRLSPKLSGGLNQPGLFGQGVEDGVGIGQESGGGVKLLQLSIFKYQHPET